MSTLALSWKNLINKPLNLALSLILFALGVGLISLLLVLNDQLEEKFEKNLAGVQLVVGAKGSPLQLILSSMYHIDAPTGNISVKQATPFLREGHPVVDVAVPLSLGDSYRSFRIVGTEPHFLNLYEAEVEQGELWETTMQVTLGADVAQATGLKIGDTFQSNHGFDNNEDLVHDEAAPFVVVGILAPTGAVIDQLILTRFSSLWAVHDGHDHADEAHDDHDHDGHDHEGHEHNEHEHNGHEHEGHEHDEHEHEGHEHEAADKAAQAEEPYPNALIDYPDKQITSMLIGFKGRNIQALNMQRNINENTEMQAATPAIEINRLYSLMGTGTKALRWLALIIIIVSGLSIFISLYSSLKERRYELALMRVMGASRGKLLLLIVLEGLILAALGYLLGMLLSHGAMYVLADQMKQTYQYNFAWAKFLPEEAYLLGGSLLIGLVAALIPALQASSTDISETLAEG